jgi:hypothetical protein
VDLQRQYDEWIAKEQAAFAAKDEEKIEQAESELNRILLQAMKENITLSEPRKEI